MKYLSEVYPIGEKNDIKPKKVDEEVMIDKGFVLRIGHIVMAENYIKNKGERIFFFDKETLFSDLLKIVIKLNEPVDDEKEKNIFSAQILLEEEKESAEKISLYKLRYLLND